MSYYPEFSRLLNQALQSRDRSASWLAQRLGVSPSTVGRWLNNGTRPGTPEMVSQIADILGITADRQALLVAASFGYVQARPDPPSAESSDGAEAAVPEIHISSRNLPVPATPLVGRTMESAQLTAWFSDPTKRLVTIVGPGGMGKTRLALAVARPYRHHLLPWPCGPFSGLPRLSLLRTVAWLRFTFRVTPPSIAKGRHN